MKLICCLLILFSIHPALAQVSGQGKLVELQNSHNDANIPSEKEFYILLNKELVSYFLASGRPVFRVDYKLLRPWLSPTQSGVSWPKYYAWVKVYDRHDQLLCSGAVRVAAIRQVRLEITHYLDAPAIAKDPDSVGKIFPALLCDGIVGQARSALAENKI